jgi:hypothetical protein
MTLPVMMATATFPEEVFIRHPELQPDVTLLKPHDVTDFLVAVGKMLYAHSGVSESQRRRQFAKSGPHRIVCGRDD